MDADRCPDPERWRTALSARLDREDAAIADAELDRHLEACPECRAWYAESRELSSELRATRPPAPDLTLHLIGVTEAHICGCHYGEPCECTNCQCVDCTCGRRVS